MSTTPPTMTLQEAWANIRNKSMTPLNAPVIFGGQFKSGCPRDAVITSAQKLDPSEALAPYLPRQKSNRRNTIEQMARTLTARALNCLDRDVNLYVADNGKRDSSSRFSLHISDRARASLSDVVYSIEVAWDGQAINNVAVAGGDTTLHADIKRLVKEAESMINSKPWQEGWGALHSSLRSVPLWRATYLLTYVEQVVIADAWRAIARDAYKLLIGRADNPLDIALESISALVKAELEQCQSQETGESRQRRGTIAERLERAQQMSRTIETLSSQLGEVDHAIQQSNQALCERLEALLDEIPEGRQSAPKSETEVEPEPEPETEVEPEPEPEPEPEARQLRVTASGSAFLSFLNATPEVLDSVDEATRLQIEMLTLIADSDEALTLDMLSADEGILNVINEMIHADNAYIAH